MMRRMGDGERVLPVNPPRTIWDPTPTPTPTPTSISADLREVIELALGIEELLQSGVDALCEAEFIPGGIRACHQAEGLAHEIKKRARVALDKLNGEV
jgi:hypothetical protein